MASESDRNLESHDDYDRVLRQMAEDAFEEYKRRFGKESANAFNSPVFVFGDKTECERFKLFLLRNAGGNGYLPSAFINLQVKTADSYLFDELKRSVSDGKSDGMKLLTADVLKDLTVHVLSDEDNCKFIEDCEMLSEYLHSNTIETDGDKNKMNLVNLYDASGTLADLYMEYLNDLGDGKSFEQDFLGVVNQKNSDSVECSDERFVLDNSWQARLYCKIREEFGIDSLLKSLDKLETKNGDSEAKFAANGRYKDYVTLAALFYALSCDPNNLELSQDAYYLDNANAVRPALHTQILERLKGNSRFHAYSVAKTEVAGNNFHSEFQKLIAAPSKIREIEGVHAEICKLMQRYDNHSYNLDDILILAPSISDYRNAIHQVFSVAKGKYGQNGIKYPYIPVDVRGAKTESQVFNIIKILFSIAEKGYYTRKDFFSLLSFDLISRKFGISDDDISNYKEAIESMNVYRRRPVFDENGERKTKDSRDIWKEDWKEGRARALLSQLMDKGEVFGEDDESLAAYDTLFGLDDGLAPFSSFIGLLEEWLEIFDVERNDSFKDFMSNNFEYDCRRLAIRDLSVGNDGRNDSEALEGDDIDSIASVFGNLLISDFGNDDDDLKSENAIVRSVLRKAYELRNLYASKGWIPYYIFKETLLDSMDEISLKDELSVNGGVRADSLNLSNPIPCKYLFLVGFGSNAFCISRQENVLDFRLLRDAHFSDRRHDAKASVLKAQIGITEKLWVSFTNKDLKKDEDFYLSSEIADILETSYGFKLPENLNEKSEKYVPLGINWSDEKDTRELWTAREYRNMSYSMNFNGNAIASNNEVVK